MCNCSMAISSNPIIALLYDMGESKCFQDVFEHFDQNSIKYKAVLSTAALANAKLLKINPQDHIPLKQTSPNNALITWKREDRLENQELLELIEKVKVLNPQALITGCVSKLQLQVACELKKNLPNLQLYAFYDNLNQVCEQKPQTEYMQGFLNGDFQILAPSKTIKDILDKNLPPFRPSINVGHPALDRFVSDCQSVNKKEVLLKLGLSSDIPIVTYVGGYDSEYEEAFEHFLSCVENIQKTTPLQVIIQTHPKVHQLPESELPERKILDKFSLSHVHVLQKQLSTPEAVAISDLCASYGSTVIPQARFAGKKACFIAKAPVCNLMTKSGIVESFSSFEDFKNYLETPELSLSNHECYKKGGVPTQGALNIFQLLKKSLYLHKSTVVN